MNEANRDLRAEIFGVLNLLYSRFVVRPEGQNSLGEEQLSAVVFRAFVHGRMRVVPHSVQWLVVLIGAERAWACISLPKITRRIRTNW